MTAEPITTRVRPAGNDAQVVTREGGHGGYMKRPCTGCPWRTDTVGDWPAEAFRHSAETAGDMATHMFGCHETASSPHPATCAGFLLRGADHNMGVRMRVATGAIDLDSVNSDVELHDDYVAMAVANGVSPSDPALRNARRSWRAEQRGDCTDDEHADIVTTYDEPDGYGAECRSCGAEWWEDR